MSTPPRMPVASNGVMPLPMADWRCAWLGAHKTAFTAMNDSDRSFSRIEDALIRCLIRLKTQHKTQPITCPCKPHRPPPIRLIATTVLQLPPTLGAMESRGHVRGRGPLHPSRPQVNGPCDVGPLRLPIAYLIAQPRVASMACRHGSADAWICHPLVWLPNRTNQSASFAISFALPAHTGAASGSFVRGC